jgi:NAD(P)-dependent dehydrogenase (short-subunit alcohol dehydrogenase family)
VSDFDLSGRRAVVTGGGRGLGRAMAMALARAGADLVLVSRSAEQLEMVADEVQALGRRTWCVPADLGDPRATADLADRIDAAGGPVQIVVHSAGTQLRKPAVDVTVDEWDALMAVNLTSPYFLSCRLGERMHAAGIEGRHIFVTSLTSNIGIPNISPYCASKSGLMGVVRALAVEWATTGSTVNAVQPGYFHTDLTEALLSDPPRRDWVLGRTPMARLGTGDDLAGTVVFLASAASRYITGQAIAVDGGWLAS